MEGAMGAEEKPTVRREEQIQLATFQLCAIGNTFLLQTPAGFLLGDVSKGTG